MKMLCLRRWAVLCARDHPNGAGGFDARYPFEAFPFCERQEPVVNSLENAVERFRTCRIEKVRGEDRESERWRMTGRNKRKPRPIRAEPDARRPPSISKQ